MIIDPREARWLLAQHFHAATVQAAVEGAARVVGTADEQEWVLNVCAHLEDLPGGVFERGTEVTVRSTGEVVRAILTLARWKAISLESQAMATAAARVHRLLEDLNGAAHGSARRASTDHGGCSSKAAGDGA